MISSIPQRTGFVWPERPNWASPVKELFEFKSGVIPSRAGFNYPAALRAKPRVQYQFRSDRTQLAAQRSFVDRNLFPSDGIWVMPVYWRPIQLASQPVASDTTLSVDVVPDWVQQGTEIVLESDDDQEVVAVSSSAGSTITLVEPVQRSYTGAKAYLGVAVRVDTSTGLESFVRGHAGASVKLSSDPVRMIDWPTSFYPSETTFGYETYPVALFNPNFRSEATRTMVRPVETADFGRGAISQQAFRDFSTIEFGFLFSGMTAQSVERAVSFFNWAKGRRGLFWCPIPVNTVSDPVGVAGSNSITTSSTDIQLFPTLDMLGHMLITWPGGCRQAVKVSSISAHAAGSQVVFETNLGYDVTSAAKIEWLALSRFRSDVLEVDWQTSEVAEIAIMLESQRIDSALGEQGPVSNSQHNSIVGLMCP